MRIKSIALLLVLPYFCFGLRPERSYTMTPETFGKIPFKEQTIATPDSAQLFSWVLLPSGSVNLKTSIILANGDAGNMSYLLVQGVLLAQKGFTVVLFDYRGFGESSDFEINSDYLYYNEFATDLQAVIKHTRINIKNTQTGVLAFSMGTIMATLAATKEKIDFYIGDGFVASPLLIKERLKELKNADVLLPADADKYEGFVKGLSVKMLLIGGKLDVITTNSDCAKVVGKTKNRKLVEYDGNHLQGFGLMPKGGHGEEYVGTILNFLGF
ncbi:MAG: alpha/beta fold hydrolase [Bacteroidia bacterium]|nr:alpha/beta fold hydrolase [Bacteroidia bacterium]